MERKTGEYVTVTTTPEKCSAFVPAPLPPDPPLEITPSIKTKLEKALVSLGRLDSISVLLPDTSLFLYMYIRKEAVLSSQIEGTQSSLSDLLLFEDEEAPGVPLDDVQEVSNYVTALNHGLDQVKNGLPFSIRLIREVHKTLLQKGRGSDKTPGEFRHSQVWIGGSRPGNASFVLPPHDAVPDCMAALEKFVNDVPDRTDSLIKAALAHVQFETIHPFLDGNGRVGRLLITLIFCIEGILREPLLYLSLYFKSNRDRYYDLLQNIRTTGNWEEWLEFFTDGVHQTAERAVDTAKKLNDIFSKDRDSAQKLGRIASSVLRVHYVLQRHPVASIQKLVAATGLTTPTVTSALKKLEELGIVKEITGKGRNKLYAYTDYMAILSEGTEPL